MSQFKDSSYMHRRAGASMGLATAASANTVLGLTRLSTGLLGFGLIGINSRFNKDAVLAYGSVAFFAYVVTLWSSWDVMFGRLRFSENNVAYHIVALLFVNAMVSIAANNRDLSVKDKALRAGYAQAWLVGMFLLFIGYVIVGLIFNRVNLTPEVIIIGGFILFNLYPKLIYSIVRDILGNEYIFKKAEEGLNARIDRDAPQNKKKAYREWCAYKRSLRLKSLWKPSLMNFFTLPFVYFLLKSPI